ncbi:MAG: neutral zinc metallopeptidase [Xanthobacteraceae bacterium]
MRWDEFRRSSNVEDDRGASGGFSMPGGAHGLGLGTIIILGLVGWALGIDPSTLINGAEILSGGGQIVQQSGPPPADDARTAETKDFVAAVLGDTEDRWSDVFAAMGRTYHPPRLRLYSGALDGGCGMAQSAMGPFYCPQDKELYLDMSFFRDMQDKFDACSSDKACRFSEAYVIAHEVGHHVQDELGTLPRVMAAQQAAASKTQVNALQVRVELQADCYAGIWANRAQAKHKFLDPGDVDQALQTAAAIGDDRLQKEMQGYVVPDSFTHGTSAQRKRWFQNGFNSGQLSACDTMAANSL